MRIRSNFAVAYGGLWDDVTAISFAYGAMSVFCVGKGGNTERVRIVVSN